MSLLIENGSQMSTPTRKPPPDTSTWSGRIKKARKDAQLTQKELSDHVHISQPVVSAWEKGEAEPNLAQYRAIASATGADVVWLLFGREPTDSNSLSGIAADAQKKNRNFAWTVYETSRMFAEEGIKADFLTVLGYVQKFLDAAKNSPDDSSAQKAIFGKIEAERAELRKALEQILKKGL
jgi:transcriptional regulator with XRE-family HTH domain